MWNKIMIQNSGLQKEVEYCRKVIQNPSKFIVDVLNDNEHDFRYVNGMASWKAEMSLKNNIKNPKDILNEAKINGFWANEILAVVYHNEFGIDRYILVG